jgi:hypothetical protein
MKSDRYSRAVTSTGVFNILVSGLATVLLMPALVRQVGIDAYGIWSLLSIFVAASAFVEFGVVRALVYHVARSPGQAPTFMRWAMRTVFATFMILAGTVGALQILGVSVFGRVLENRPAEAAWVIGAGLAVTALQAVATLFRSVLEGNDAADRNNIGFAALTLGQYGAVSTVAQFSTDVRALLATSVIVYASILVLHVIWARAYLVAPSRAPAVSRTSFSRFALSAFASDVPSLLFVPLVMFLVARAADGPAEYAAFDIGVRIAAMAAAAVALLGLPVFSAVARSAEGDLARVHEDVTRRMLASLLVATVGWTVYLFAAPTLLAMIGLPDISGIRMTSTIVMGGAVMMAAMEPIVRLQFGTASMVKLLPARAAVLFCTVVSALTLGSLGTLERYSIAMAAGYVGGAIVLWSLIRAGRAAWTERAREPQP